MIVDQGGPDGLQDVEYRSSPACTLASLRPWGRASWRTCSVEGLDYRNSRIIAAIKSRGGYKRPPLLFVRYLACCEYAILNTTDI